jgi:NADH:ubiquinone oxidoreductase subunit F (NADH-binding)
MTAVTENPRAAATGLPRLLPPPGPADTAPGETPAAGETQAPGQTHDPAARPVGRPAYRDRPGVLISEIEAAGLTGRGGAAFPVHRKLQAVRDAAAARRRAPLVVANAAESEPASEKDAILLWLSPHLVLDGLQLAAEAVGADTVILAAHAGRAHDVGRLLSEVLRARQAAGVDRVPVQLVQVPGRFLSGQETALVSYLAGGPAIPAFTPPRITERGLGGAPTLVQNVETLAHLALIARHGPDWFRSVGTDAEPGSMLATVRRADGQPKVTEVPLGIPLRTLTGALRPDDAVLVGGYHGTWLTGRQALGLTLDNASLARAEARVGAGVVITLPASHCGLVETARVVRYLALESAGQCGPCLNGLPRIAAALAEIAGGRARPQTAADVARWSGLVSGRGACHHPDGTVRFVRSALRAFAAEADRHQRGHCSATDTRPFLPVPAVPSTVPARSASVTPGGREPVAGTAPDWS